MKLAAKSGDAVELVVLRYEFPDMNEDRWDSNWLVVSGRVSLAGKTWRFTDPCFTTFELAELAEWFDAIAKRRDVAPEFEFTEPNVVFAYSATPQPTLRVRFAHESAPPWVKNEKDRLDGVTIEFPLSNLDIAAITAEVRAILIEYPIRGGAA
jgi:hypothetical protein